MSGSDDGAVGMGPGDPSDAELKERGSRARRRVDEVIRDKAGLTGTAGGASDLTGGAEPTEDSDRPTEHG